MRKTTFLLIGIFLVALVLRFWQLGKVPLSPDWDEVSLGYNAYSLMQTGKDEYGQSLPIILRSFDDYKPALYVYLAIPFIKIFGLEVFAVRLPSIIFGTLTVLATYFLVKELFGRTFLSSRLGLLAAGLLAISPWHMQFSRIAFEANVGVAFNVFGALFFMLSFRQPLFLTVSAIFFGLNLYVYQGEKVFVPLLLSALVTIFRRELFSLPKLYLILAVLIGGLITLPIINYTITNKEALSRAKGVSVFADITPFLEKNVKRLAQDKEQNDYIGIIVDNRRVEYIKAIMAGYVAHFDLNWLFVEGDIARHHAPNMALLYLWELPLLLVGIYAFVFGNFSLKAKLSIFTWILLAPIPASITSGVPHAVRTLNFLPTFQIFTAVGIISILHTVLSIKYRALGFKVGHLLVACYLLFTTLGITYYLNQYFVQQNYFNSADWQYGYKEAVGEVKKIENKYEKIIVSNEPHLDQSYMFFLFYLKYPPNLYQQSEAKNLSGGFREKHLFGKYEFRPIKWDSEKKEKNTLYVGRQFDFPQNDFGHVKTFYFLDGTPAIKIVEVL